MYFLKNVGIPKERHISPEKNQQITDELKLMYT